jgi:hypothetical protein
MKRTLMAMLIALVLPFGAVGWVPTGTYYYGGAFKFQLGDICDSVRFPLTPGTCAGDAGNPNWATEFTTALGRWNSATDLFNFTTDPGAGASVPGTCDALDPGSTFFLADVCGTPFGGSTLAVARTFFYRGAYAIHSDIVFNTAFTWGVYDDALIGHPGVTDFRRVAVHESGHVLGLNHAPHTDSIMYFAIQDLIAPRPDDLNGLISIYGILATDVMPDTNGNSVQELVALRSKHDGSINAEIRDANTGALLRTMTFLTTAYSVVNGIVIPDQDGNGAPELAVLGIRKSDGRGVVEIRNLSGAESPRMIWFATGLTPIKVVAVNDADSNGIMELAVLSTRNSDLRGVVEIKNSFGPTLPNTIWCRSLAWALDITTVPDADSNGVPEVAVLLARASDNRGVVEIKNASGPLSPSEVWAMPGVRAKAVESVADADSNGVPEVAILSARNSDGRIVVEVRNAAGAPSPSILWFTLGQSPWALASLPDLDANGVEEIAVLSRRSSDGRILVEVKNASGAINPNAVWFSPGFEPVAMMTILDDADGNTVDEVAVMLSRPSDGRLVVEERNARGAAAPRSIWLTP